MNDTTDAQARGLANLASQVVTGMLDPHELRQWVGQAIDDNQDEVIDKAIASCQPRSDAQAHLIGGIRAHTGEIETTDQAGRPLEAHLVLMPLRTDTLRHLPEQLPTATIESLMRSHAVLPPDAQCFLAPTPFRLSELDDLRYHVYRHIIETLIATDNPGKLKPADLGITRSKEDRPVDEPTIGLRYLVGAFLIPADPAREKYEALIDDYQDEENCDVRTYNWIRATAEALARVLQMPQLNVSMALPLPYMMAIYEGMRFYNATTPFVIADAAPRETEEMFIHAFPAEGMVEIELESPGRQGRMLLEWYDGGSVEDTIEDWRDIIQDKHPEMAIIGIVMDENGDPL